MSNVFSLDSMREELERQFAPVTVEFEDKEVVLRSLLRISKSKREQVYALLDELTALQEDNAGLASTEDSAQIVLQILPLVADDEKLCRKMVEAIGDDLALALRVFSAWMDATQVGEADRSQS
jgi:hypothetical protein